MAQAGAPARNERFRVWIRRGDEPLAPFSLRFEVTDGKGILRVARPGVLVDPPARPENMEERLTASQLRASRFLHVWDGGRHRQGHLFARLDEGALDGLPADRWVPLVSVREGTTALLLLPSERSADPGTVDDESAWPRRELRGLARAMQAEPDAEVRATPIVEDGLPGRRVATAARHALGGARSARGGEARGEPALGGAASDELISVATVEDDWTMLIRGPTSLPPSAAPRPVLPKLSGLPDATDHPSDEHAQIEAFDAEDALDALEAATAVGFAPEEASEVFNAIEATEDHGGAGQALDAAEEEEREEGPLEAADDLDKLEVFDPFGVDAPVVNDFRTQRVPEPRGLAWTALTDPITVMPEGAQELAADNAVRPAAVRATSAPAAWSGAAPSKAAASPPAELGPAETMHERSTTLVRHLRRRLTNVEVQMAVDRERIAGLAARVAELEAELARRR